jgi:predicted transcriptional regulator
MSNEIRAMWPKFDELANKAQSTDTKILVEAIKLQTELLNMRLAPLEHLLGSIARGVGK